ncbi:4683_t:CDS:2, partial [Gigaspora margarita]
MFKFNIAEYKNNIRKKIGDKDQFKEEIIDLSTTIKRNLTLNPINLIPLLMSDCLFFILKLDIFNLIGKETGIWYRKQHIGRNSLSGFMKDLVHKTAAQLMQEKDIEEQVIMNITGHRKPYFYLTNQEIPNNQLIQDLNEQSLTLRNSQITNLESQNLPIYTSPDNNIQEKTPIFSNCQFQN